MSTNNSKNSNHTNLNSVWWHTLVSVPVIKSKQNSIAISIYKRGCLKNLDKFDDIHPPQGSVLGETTPDVWHDFSYLGR